jgi:hypothetical protein
MPESFVGRRLPVRHLSSMEGVERGFVDVVGE